MYTGKVMKVTVRNLFPDAGKICRAEDSYNGAALPVLGKHLDQTQTSNWKNMKVYY